jgi:glycosyltransferase involved in cell wall biosynthesis
MRMSDISHSHKQDLSATALYDRILDVYEDLGLPRAVIGQWCIPKTDAVDLFEVVQSSQPARILEVGTYVGVSTMVLAAAANGSAEVVTIDPNFPVGVEMRSMGSDLANVDESIPAQEICRRAAELLGLSNGIRLIQGGFASRETFVSRVGSPSLLTRVRGPDLVKQNQQFNLIFIDGLHYADVVHKDLILAARMLAKGGVILMHDCIGMWGTNVRTGIFRFLADHPEWRLVHPSYGELYRSIGIVFRANEHQKYFQLLRSEQLPAREVNAKIHHVVIAINNGLRPKGIIEIGSKQVVSNIFAELGIETSFIQFSPINIDDGISALLREAGRIDQPLLVSFGMLDILDDVSVRRIFRIVAGRELIAVFACTPPGESGVAGNCSRPLRRLIRLAAGAGLEMGMISNLELDQSNFAFSEKEVYSDSLLSELVVVASPKAMQNILAKSNGPIRVLGESLAEEIEQASLLQIHYGQGFRSLFSQLSESTKANAQLRLQIRNHELNDASDKKVEELTQPSTQHPPRGEENDCSDHQSPEQIGGEAEVFQREHRQYLPVLHKAIGRSSEVSMAFAKGCVKIVLAGRAGFPRQLGAIARSSDLSMAFAKGCVKIVLAVRAVFRRQLDNLPDRVVADTLIDAERRKLTKICMILSWEADAVLLRQYLENPRIASIGVKDRFGDSLLPEDLRDNPRVGRYWHHGDWVLPSSSQHVYFVGSWRLFTRAMLREAYRKGVISLRIRFGTIWISIPLAQIRHVAPFLVVLLRWKQRATDALHATGRLLTLLPRYLVGRARGLETRVLSQAATEDLASSMERALARLADDIQPCNNFIPGRVVLVCGNLSPGGAERQVVYTLQGLAKSQLESVQLLCHSLAAGPLRHDFYLPKVEALRVPVREIRKLVTGLDDPNCDQRVMCLAPSLPQGLLIDIANLVREFQELKPEVVHAWLDWDNIRAGLAAALAGVPHTIVSGRNINPSNFELFQPYMAPVYKAMSSIPTIKFINNSRAGADDYADWIGISKMRIEVIHNGIDLGDRVRLSDEVVAVRRREIGISPSAFVIGGVFRLEREKRPFLWLDTAARIAAQIPNAYFLVYGQGRLSNELAEYARKLGIADRLLMHGVTDDIISALSLMDVFLLTSYGEGLPNVILEAQWVGIPVVATNAGGTREAVEAGVTGWVIDSDRPADLATAVVRLYKKQNLRDQARAMGPTLVREKFGVDRMIAETLAVYGFTSRESMSVSNAAHYGGSRKRRLAVHAE